MRAVTPDGHVGMFGDSLAPDRADVTVTVTGGEGQLLQVKQDGHLAGLPVLITSDVFTHTFTATRSSRSGPLGTFWRVDTFDFSPSPRSATPSS